MLVKWSRVSAIVHNTRAYCVLLRLAHVHLLSMVGDPVQTGSMFQTADKTERRSFLFMKSCTLLSLTFLCPELNTLAMPICKGGQSAFWEVTC